MEERYGTGRSSPARHTFAEGASIPSQSSSTSSTTIHILLFYR